MGIAPVQLKDPCMHKGGKASLFQKITYNYSKTSSEKDIIATNRNNNSEME